jgi:hypothetical protein
MAEDKYENISYYELSIKQVGYKIILLRRGYNGQT